MNYTSHLNCFYCFMSDDSLEGKTSLNLDAYILMVASLLCQHLGCLSGPRKPAVTAYEHRLQRSHISRQMPWSGFISRYRKWLGFMQGRAARTQVRSKDNNGDNLAAIKQSWQVQVLIGLMGKLGTGVLVSAEDQDTGIGEKVQEHMVSEWRMPVRMLEGAWESVRVAEEDSMWVNEQGGGVMQGGKLPVSWQVGRVSTACAGQSKQCSPSPHIHPPETPCSRLVSHILLMLQTEMENMLTLGVKRERSIHRAVLFPQWGIHEASWLFFRLSPFIQTDSPPQKHHRTFSWRSLVNCRIIGQACSVTSPPMCV